MRLLVVMFALGCGNAPVSDKKPVDASVSKERTVHWYERYVEDSCNRCPDCCVYIPSNNDDSDTPLQKVQGDKK